MAKEGSVHRTMREAFSKRLHDLYPAPPHEYSEGGVVPSVCLKPDIYVKHPDGRQWAFEMVHHNQHSDHLLENHQQYAEAGIDDIWILWDAHRPKSRSRRESPPEQGLLLPFTESQRVYTLTKPQLAVLEMQSGQTRHIYTFTVNPLDSENSLVRIALMQMLGIGVCIYRFEGWAGQSEYPTACDYVLISDLEFAPDGALRAAKDEAEDIWATMLERLDLEQGGTVIPSEAVRQVEAVLLSPEGQQRLAELLVQQVLQSLPPDEFDSVVRALGRAEPIESPLGQELTPQDAVEASDDAESMERLAMRAKPVRQHIECVDLPAPLKEILVYMMDQSDLEGIAGWMKWQEQSEALDQFRQDD